jgi:hypothetical protein
MFFRFVVTVPLKVREGVNRQVGWERQNLAGDVEKGQTRRVKRTGIIGPGGEIDIIS